MMMINFAIHDDIDGIGRIVFQEKVITLLELQCFTGEGDQLQLAIVKAGQHRNFAQLVRILMNIH